MFVLIHRSTLNSVHILDKIKNFYITYCWLSVSSCVCEDSIGESSLLCCNNIKLNIGTARK